MPYDGFFIRDNVGDTPSGPNGNSWTNSPDIICNGPRMLSDPQSILNLNNYNTGQPNVSNQAPFVQNYVYIRGINPQTIPQTSTVYFYYADTSLVLWPQNFKKDGITQAGNPQNFQQLNAPASTDNHGLAGTIVPFVWIPPRDNTHYCLVAWANNGPKQLTPPDLSAIGSVPNMADFILSHPNIGWRNTLQVTGSVGTMQGESAIEGPSSGGVMTIGLQCENMPTDGEIAFQVPGPDKDNSITFDRIKIGKPNYGPTFRVTYPPGFKTAIQFQYWAGPTPVPPGSNVVAFVATWNSTEEFLARVAEIAPRHLATVDYLGTPTEYEERKASGTESTGETKTVMIIGSVPFELIK